MSASRRLPRIVAVVLAALGAAAADGAGPEAIPPLQDNSFLIEEAYNQSYGVVQNINTATRSWNHRDWAYSFTQEWPVDWEPRHQLSYTVPALHSSDFPRSGFGVGDVALNYRYQLLGDGNATLAIAPRLSVLVPSGDEKKGRGLGGVAIQTNWAVSWVLSQSLVTHWNVGGTVVPREQNELGEKATAAGYNVGSGIVWLAFPRLNFLVETVYASSETVNASERVRRQYSLFVNPGLRAGFDFAGGLQIVPGVSFPLGIGPSAGERMVFLYLSFELPYRSIPDEQGR